jgi:hypothetical protein
MMHLIELSVAEVLLPSTVGTSILTHIQSIKGIGRVLGPSCPYGQVIKTRSNDRIVKVERRAVIGAYWRLEKMLVDSEDSSKLNTSFVERLNLTIRQGSAYLVLWRHNNN